MNSTNLLLILKPLTTNCLNKKSRLFNSFTLVGNSCNKIRIIFANPYFLFTFRIVTVRTLK